MAKRFITIHRGLSLVVAIVITVIIAFAVFRKSGLLSYQVSKYVNDHYLEDSPYRFYSGNISGDLINTIVISDAVLRYHTGDRIFEVFRAKEISLDYNLLETLKLKMLINKIELKDLRIALERDEEGNLLVPPLPADDGGSATAPHVEIKEFAITNLDLSYRDHERKGVSVHDIDVAGSLSYVEGVTLLGIDSGGAHLVDSNVDIHSLRAEVGYDGEEVTLSDFVVRLDKSFIMASGKYRDGRLHHVQGIFNPVDLAEMSTIGVMPKNSGEIGGNVVVEGRPDSLSISGSLTGKGFGLVFSSVSVEGSVTPEEMYLSRLEGMVFGSRLNGGLTFDRRDGSYAFQGVCEGLDISQGFLPDQDVPSTNLNGLVNVDYAAGSESYEVKADLRRSSVNDFESEEMRLRLGWREATGLTVRSLALSRPGFDLKGSGVIDAGGNVDLLVDVAGSKLDYLMDYVALPRLGGRVDLSGKLIGPLDGMQLNLNGTWRNLSYDFASIDSAQIQAQATGIQSKDVNAVVDVTGNHLDLKGRRFDNPHVHIEATPSRVVFRDFSFSRGDTLVTSNFELLPDVSRQTILVKHLELRTPDTSWRNPDVATLILTEGTIDVRGLELHSNGHRLGIEGSYSTAAGTCDLNLWGTDIDMSLVRDAMGLETPIRGVGRFNATVRGDIDNPSVQLGMRLVEGVVDSLEFDELAFDGRFNETGEYHVQSLVLREGLDSLVASGHWRYGDSPIKVAREGFSKDKAMQAPVSIKIRSSGYSLSPIFEAMHREPPWRGSFDGDVTIDRTLATPVVSIGGSLSSTSNTGQKLPPISVRASYKDEMLTIESVSFDDGKTKGNASGQIPLTLTFESGAKLREDGQMRVNATISSSDLAGLAPYYDRVAGASGALVGSFRIGGTPKVTTYEGTLDFERCAFRLAGMSEVYRDVTARVELDNNTVHFRSIQGRQGKKGTFSGMGSAKLEGFKVKWYHLAFDIKDMTVTSIPDFESTQSGRIEVASRVNGEGDVIPAVSGKLNVKQAVISQALGKPQAAPSPLTMPTETPTWLCDIDIEAPKNVQFKNTDLKMEMGGNLILKRDKQGLFLRGDLSVLRGSYNLYNNKFRITEGRFDFSTATTLRPDITLNAYTPHRRPGEEEHRIFLVLSWPADKLEPTISLSYDVAGYSEADIWKMLGGQVVAGDAGLSTSGTAQNIASNYLERILSAQMSDMTVEVESRTRDNGGTVGSNERELSIAVGRYLSEDLYLKYRQGLNFSTERQVDIEYRISNMFLLRSEIIRHSQRGLKGKSRQATDEINFDIKFRWEY